MARSIRCSCGARIDIPTEYSGEVISCPACQRKEKVPRFKKKVAVKRDREGASVWTKVGLIVVTLAALAGLAAMTVWTILNKRDTVASASPAAASSSALTMFDTSPSSQFGSAPNPFQPPVGSNPFPPPANPFQPPANPFQPPPMENPAAPPAPPPAQPQLPAPPSSDTTPIQGAVVLGPKESVLVAMQEIELMNRQKQPGKVHSIAVSPDGRIVLAGGSIPPHNLDIGQSRRQSTSGVVLAWDAATWKPLPVFPKDYKPPVVEGSAGMVQVAFWGDSRHALCIMESGDSLICELGGGQKPRPVKLTNAAIQRVLHFEGPPSHRAVVDGDDDSLLLWDFDKPQLLQQFIGHAQHPRSAIFLPDGKRLLSSSHDGTLRLWDAKSGKELRRHDFEKTGLYPQAVAIALLPKTNQVLLGDNAGLTVWDVEQWQASRQIRGPILSIDRGPKAEPLVGQRVLLNWNRVPARIQAITCTPDGRQALLTCGDNTVRLFDLEKDQELCVYIGHTAHIECLAILPEDRGFVTGGADGYLRVWEMPTPGLLARVPPPTDLAAVTPKDPTPLRNQPRLRLYSGGHGFEHGAAFSRDGRRAVTCADHVTVAKPGQALREELLRVWSIDPIGELRRGTTVGPAVTSVAISPDGKLAVSGCLGPAFGGDLAVRVWDLENGKVVRQLTGHSGGVGCVAWSADGKRIVSGGAGDAHMPMPERDYSIIVWNAGGGEIRRLVGHVAGVNSVAFSPDGKLIVSASGKVDRQGKPLPAKVPDNTLRLWDAGSGKELRHFEGHADPILCAVFSPDGKRLLSGGTDRTMRLWDVATSKELRRFDGHKGGVARVAFAPNGKRALSGGAANDGVVRLWDLETGQELLQYQANITGVMALAFTPDGRDAMIAAASDLLLLRLPE